MAEERNSELKDILLETPQMENKQKLSAAADNNNYNKCNNIQELWDNYKKSVDTHILKNWNTRKKRQKKYLKE